MSTLFAFSPAPGHTWAQHPENLKRLAGLRAFFGEQGVLSDLIPVDAVRAAVRQVTRVHTVGLVEQVRNTSRRGGGLLDPDTYTTGESYDMALLAAGSCCAVVDSILEGAGENGLAVVRPPGHHAERDRAGGFCLFNNVAIAARHAQAVHGVTRVLIVDFDVHHGNGTQEIFYGDENVLYISLHLYHPFFYPGTGAYNELGRGAGRGTTVNIPFPPRVGDVGYDEAMSAIVIPRARQFRPEIILVSAGFDAHWEDPLAHALLSLNGYALMTRRLIALAQEFCHGRILFVLEGGYRREALRYGLLNVVHALSGRDDVLDPLGPAPHREEDVTHLLRGIRDLHLLK